MQSGPGVNDSTGGLVGGIAGLEMSRRAPVRERTLLASLNSIAVASHVAGDSSTPVKVFSKNQRITNASKEAAPDQHRAAGEFIELGGKGDQQLFGEDDSSVYAGRDKPKTAKARGK